ncbi:hypothetical protein E4T56_gene13309 [Termitomyces sp. T112]|nr:hypothetical protein E4T56_gene13309 [Termitomyces sp. T112]
MPYFPAGQGPPSTNQPPGLCSPAQLNTASLHKALKLLNANSNNSQDSDDALDSIDNQEALCANKIWSRLWIDMPEETQEKQWKESTCILCAAFLCAMVLSLDNLSAHLPFHSSHTLLLHINLPFSTNSIPTLINSPQYSDQQYQTPLDNPATTLDPAAATPTPTPINLEALDIKIIDTILFTHILQDSTPAFQLQITLEEYIHAETTMPELKTKNQILHEVVSPESHEYADVFSEGSAKELPLHCSYDHKIDLKEGTSPPFGKIYKMLEIELWALKDDLNNMLGKGFICPLISAANILVLFAKKKDSSL